MDPIVFRALAVGAALVVGTLAGRWWQARDGRVRAGVAGAVLAPGQLDALGLDLRGASAGAVLLGSPTCAPCVQVRGVLSDLQAERTGFRWVYADAADHLGLTQEHGVLRVPTLLVVEPSGRIVARTSGVPHGDELRRVLDGEAAAGRAA